MIEQFRIQSHTIPASQRTQRAPLLCFYSCFKPAWVLPDKRQRPLLRTRLSVHSSLPYSLGQSTEPRTCSSIHGEYGLPGRKNKGPTNSWIIYSYDYEIIKMSYDVLLLGNSMAILKDSPKTSAQPPRNAEAPQPNATPQPIATPLVVVPLLRALPAKVSRLFENDSAPPHTGKSGCHESWHLNLGIILKNLGITWNNWVFWPPPLLCVFSPDAPSLAWASY